MAFTDQILADFKNCILNTNEFAEPISYTPGGGSPKTINAILVRERLTSKGPDRGIALNRDCEIYIANDAIAGVTLVNKNNDKASFPVQKGGSPVTWQIVEVMYHDDSVWHLRATK